ncbi:MAG: pseudouridine synthase [Dongiaceae bacterium]
MTAKKSQPEKSAPDKSKPGTKGERIAKLLARAGLCSRRDAERWIAAGRVSIDGVVLTSPAINVTPGMAVAVDGKPIPLKQPARLWRYYKPRGQVTTARDPQGRPTVFDAMPKDMPRVISVGRLDLNSEGLLLLTNDGELARKLELPSGGWVRRYRVRVRGAVDPQALRDLAKGITIDQMNYGPVQAALDRQQGSNAWLSFALTEGKNREVRRICEHLGWPVSRLIRVSFGPFDLAGLEAGAVEEVQAGSIELLLGGDGRKSSPQRHRHTEKKKGRQ